MMKPEDRQKPEANLRRRNFLLTASLGGAGAVAAVVATRSPITPEMPAAAPEVKGSGYQTSDHVLHYYRTTRT
ncbi:MAG: formate dehydrogenase [Sulfuritalea sp.]|jgi:hypothetical protein|nr:formate dehydrogenase [Sulfuritalea sp.]